MNNIICQSHLCFSELFILTVKITKALLFTTLMLPLPFKCHSVFKSSVFLTELQMTISQEVDHFGFRLVCRKTLTNR